MSLTRIHPSGESLFALGEKLFAHGEIVFAFGQSLLALGETVFRLREIVFGLWKVESILREIVFRLKQLVFGFCEVEFMFKEFVCHGDVTERRSKTKTILFLGVWEWINNLHFNSPEFEGIRNETDRKSFFLSAKKCEYRSCCDTGR